MTHRTISWNAPYTFSGKEKDLETGYGYFGARYYDSGLSIWLSVDPMSDKYPSMSPYNYCANNPVILVDPDGREVIFNSLIDVIVVGTQLLFNSHFRENYKELKKSEKIYLFNATENLPENYSGELTTNGVVVMINYRLTKDKIEGTNCFTNLRHETEHASQFENGMLGFDNGGKNIDLGNGISIPDWNNSSVNFDLEDEYKARQEAYNGFIWNSDPRSSVRAWWRSASKEDRMNTLKRAGYTGEDEMNNTNSEPIQNFSKFMMPYNQTR